MPRRVVQTEMTGRVPSVRGAHGGLVYTTAGCLPIHITDASSAGVRAPTSTQVVQENRVPKVEMGLTRKPS